MKCPQPNAAPQRGLPSLSLRSFNSRHTAPLRFAQVQPNSWTSHIRHTLGVIVDFRYCQGINRGYK